MGIGTALISGAALFLMQAFPVNTVFWPALFVWLAIFSFIYFFTKSHLDWKVGVYSLAITSIFALTGLIGVIEVPFVRTTISVLGALSLGLLYSFGIEGTIVTWLSKKPFIRFMMIFWVFNAYALSTLFFAFQTFFPGTLSFIVLLLGGGCMYGAIALMIWRMYFSTRIEPLYVWASLMIFVTMECLWVIHLLPFAYPVLAFFATWVWYLIHLLARFHFTKRDIIWKKQHNFIIANIILFILILLFFVKWV
ncbi:MAG: hypothetical protein CL685_01920 [Candidatus Magasanikbacteria bacterium]|nr:hypothetical protein [Candidatus Magasanikbacteria bacterium]